MNSDFNQAIGQTLKNEGGLSNNPLDPGGITKYGISLRFLQDNGIDVNKDSCINGKDITDLNLSDAISIYKFNFWEKFKIYLIDDQTIANKVFDLSVNMGGIQAIKLLQESVNMHASPALVVDGLIGLNTLKGINSVSTDVLMGDYRLFAKLFYEKLVANNPHFKEFLSGWLERAAR